MEELFDLAKFDEEETNKSGELIQKQSNGKSKGRKNASEMIVETIE